MILFYALIRNINLFQIFLQLLLPLLNSHYSSFTFIKEINDISFTFTGELNTEIFYFSIITPYSMKEEKILKNKYF